MNTKLPAEGRSGSLRLEPALPGGMAGSLNILSMSMVLYFAFDRRRCKLT